MSRVNTITFYRFKGPLNKFWALTMMQLAHKQLHGIKGQNFYKLMGSGRGMGFNAWPDWSVYALLQDWQHEDHALEFFKNHQLAQKYRSKSVEQYTIYLKNISSHGFWDKSNPFEPQVSYENGPIVALTRATIKVSKLYKFWSYVSTSQKPLKKNKALIYTKGVGEWPVVQMATISIWKSMEGLKEFAYKSKEHQVAIEKTKKLNWYKEELFARFLPYKTEGKWNDADQLGELL